ncbi:GNAT family N-acetyltransferase [Pontibacter cellulosilyticus]|uniref:GNAT family N-acetyltransferase n=1 Tax=Pontibacter cellulosilyticus TaxID=1720253 RepID=A0A923N6I2_9BACT|nr:GNAT family N-acetyltransferase [Pontibacter cellulosilyticus]MBC5992637.1 GNAT family N-acetyltransferase [Pontibacter cellulosilyticus]
MNHILQTERLNLRPFTHTDTKFIIELVNSPGWLQFIGDRNIKTEQQAKTYLENGPLKSYKDNGYGLWLVERKQDNTPIGMCGIINRDYLHAPDIGFAFLPDCCGQGYAHEIASATITFAHHNLNLPKLLAITLPNNTKSIRLLEKLGMQYTETISLPNSLEKLQLFSN